MLRPFLAAKEVSCSVVGALLIGRVELPGFGLQSQDYWWCACAGAHAPCSSYVHGQQDEVDTCVPTDVGD